MIDHIECRMGQTQCIINYAKCWRWQQRWMNARRELQEPKNDCTSDQRVVAMARMTTLVA